MSEQMRECPCCPDGAGVIYQHNLLGRELYFVGCKRCHLRTADYAGESTAIAAWNRRAGEAELAALRARVELAQSIIQEPYRDYLTEDQWNESKLNRLSQAIWGEPVQDDMEASHD